MYDRGYGRRCHGWKTRLQPIYMKNKKAFAIKYKEFDFKRAVFTDEVRIRKAERKMKDKTWRLIGEEFEEDVVEKMTQSDDFSDGMMWASIAYNRKNPIYFFFKETDEDKIALQHQLNVENAKTRSRH